MLHDFVGAMRELGPEYYTNLVLSSLVNQLQLDRNTDRRTGTGDWESLLPHDSGSCLQGAAELPTRLRAWQSEGQGNVVDDASDLREQRGDLATGLERNAHVGHLANMEHAGRGGGGASCDLDVPHVHFCFASAIFDLYSGY